MYAVERLLLFRRASAAGLRRESGRGAASCANAAAGGARRQQDRANPEADQARHDTNALYPDISFARRVYHQAGCLLTAHQRSRAAVALSLELLEEGARRLTWLAAVLVVISIVLYVFQRLMQPQIAPIFDDPINRLWR